jgi:EPS-associated MarR family transcriptional regulator
MATAALPTKIGADVFYGTSGGTPVRVSIPGGESLDGAHLNALRELSRDDTLSQRDLAGRLGLSLGRVNYVVNSLIGKGLVKARRFKNSRNKLAYRYVLTPEGIRERVAATRRFLQAKLDEFEQLQREIEDLRREATAEAGEGCSS